MDIKGIVERMTRVAFTSSQKCENWVKSYLSGKDQTVNYFDVINKGQSFGFPKELTKDVIDDLVEEKYIKKSGANIKWNKTGI